MMYTPKYFTNNFVGSLFIILLQLSVSQEVQAQSQTLRAISDFVIINENPMVFNVLENDQGLENKNVEITDFNNPLWGSLSHNGDGVFSYTGDIDIWFDIFTYTICEVGNANNCDDGTVMLLLNQCGECEDEPEEPVCATDFFGFVVVALPNACWANCLDMKITEDESCPEIMELIQSQTACNCDSTAYEPVCVETTWGSKTFANACQAECWGFDDYTEGDCVQSWDYGCYCEGSFEPVCISDSGNELFFNNSCEAYCEGFTETDFVSCSADSQTYEDTEQSWSEWIDNNICDNDCVWAGDANHDGIVNHYDLLEIGNAYGSQGFTRWLPLTSWVPQLAWDWEQSTPNGVNYKHLDTNGDGIINKADISIIEQNYGLTHGEGTIPTVVNDSMHLSLKMPTDSIGLDTTLQVPVVVGASDDLAVDFQGVAFEISYNSAYFPEGTINLDFDKTWVGAPDELLTMVRVVPERGVIEAAITRVSASTITGFGELCQVIIVAMEENLAGKKTIEQIKVPFGLGAKRSLGREEKIKTVDKTQKTLTVLVGTATGTETITNPNKPIKMRAYPNPTTDELHIQLVEKTIASVDNYTLEICNLMGQKVWESPFDATKQEETISLAAYQKGIYFVMVKNNKRENVFMEKILVLK